MPETAQENEVQQTGLEQSGVVERIFEKVAARLEERLHIPSATYRVQFNRNFTFEQARKQVDYLDRLGITDIYASPLFRAGQESLHGYDIARHNELNPSIGTDDDFARLVATMHRHGMSQVLDTVPNHMGIGEEGNAWWTDVLENGRSSIYAPYFDIDWDPINPKITDKVLLPVLGKQYGRALEDKELQVAFIPAEGRFVLHYFDKTFPISPPTYLRILEMDAGRLEVELGPESEPALEFQSILTALGHLPTHHGEPRVRALERNREKEVIKRRIAALCASEPRVRAHIERNVRAINGVEGDPRSFDRLDALLEEQPYRLSFWRVAGEEINYRRFFDVNELAAIQIDHPSVFEDTHRMIMRFLREGIVNGLRIDHVDGLRDPARYFRDLQRGYFLETCRQVMDEERITVEGADRPALEDLLLERFDAAAASAPSGVLARPLYVVAEKILARGEQLPADWAIYGTTGYEFTNDLNGVFVDGSNARAFDELYSSFTGERLNFADLVYESKKQIMRLSLASEVNMLTNMLNRVSQSDRLYRDFTLSSIRNAIREVIACFPVYRTYITPAMGEPNRRDRQVMEIAMARARKRNPAVDPSIFDFLGDILLLRGYDALGERQREERANFLMKFQQVTGPVTAKGIEDTAFYVYNRLISLNEVGGEPGYFGNTVANFHRQQAERLRAWPHSMLTTSTHDTKRSADVRARINVLSEMPVAWRAAVRRWARFNRRFKVSVDGQLAPSRNEEYFLYQTLAGIWPFKDRLTEREYDELIARVTAYMDKALNEAKVNASWVNPNEPYQRATAGFIEAILRRDPDNRFLSDFLAFQKTISFHGAFNSLSQTVVKLTGPGVPDIYQGEEIWDFSLVDPDNRRPVDYALRRRLLNSLGRVRGAKAAAGLLDTLEDGRAKLLVTVRALNFRREHAPLFRDGSYIPLLADGKHADNVMAFARQHEGDTAIVVAPRLTTYLGGAGESVAPLGALWADTWLPLPFARAGDAFRDVFTGETLVAAERDGSAGLALEQILAAFPVALLGNVQVFPSE